MVYVFVEATSPHFIYNFFQLPEFLVKNYISHESTFRESQSTNQRIATNPNSTVNDAVFSASFLILLKTFAMPHENTFLSLLYHCFCLIFKHFLCLKSKFIMFVIHLKVGWFGSWLLSLKQRLFKDAVCDIDSKQLKWVLRSKFKISQVARLRTRNKNKYNWQWRATSLKARSHQGR